MSINYEYIVDKFIDLSKEVGQGPFLDFGCGAGQIVEKGVAAGLDFYGADAYPEGRNPYYDVLQKDRPHIGERIHRIEDGKLPFPDGYFKGVVTNMVFEHIDNLETPLAEIQRVLAPGGLFLALFPTSEILWEGHAKLYFAHMFKPHSKLQYYYLRTMKQLGFGKADDRQNPDEWARHFQKYLESYVFYYTPREVKQLWDTAFQKQPDRWESDYMLYRIEKNKKLRKFGRYMKHGLGRWILSQVCLRRGFAALALYK